MNFKKLLFVILLPLAGCNLGQTLNGNSGDLTDGNKLTSDDVKAQMTDFINENLVQPGSNVEIKEFSSEECLYKMVVNFNGQDITSYVSQDAKTFFPQAIIVEDMKKQQAEAKKAQGDQAAAEAKDLVKNDKPVVELFVMSHCPFGTQIEKGILPVIETLGDKIDFELKFCDYAMHGEEELQEQLAQYCIQKEQNDLLTPYLQCFLKEGKSEECIVETGINKDSLDSCVALTDAEFKVMESFADESTWVNGRFPQFNVHKEDSTAYGVQGSPTLVINGSVLSTQRDPKGILTTICSAFENPPEECNADLSSEAPSSGFGFEASATGNSDASCG